MKIYPITEFPQQLLLIATLFGVSSQALARCDVENVQDETATGYVFLDQNQNKLRDAGEAGIAAVSVSNGCEVVRSDAQGRYQISLAPTEILFISQPAGYTVALDEFNIPRFFYSHYPQGTPEIIAGTSLQWRWPVTEASGPLPASIDFPLNRIDNQSARFTAHGFADPQAKFELGQDMVREDLVNTLIANPYGASFGITVGDVVYDTLSLYDRHKEMMSLMDMPQWYLPGNHDINFESPNATFANETYKRHFGPTYYSFNQGNVHFVSLNNVEYAGAGKNFEGEPYRGYIPADQLLWLERDLANVDTQKLIVLASHIPFITEAEDQSGSEKATGPFTENFSQLLEILTPFENIYAIAGHDTSNSWKVEVNHSHGWSGQPWIAHTLAEVRGNGWLTGIADPRGVRDAMMQDGNPNGFYLFQFDNSSVTPEFIPFPYGADAMNRMRIVLDPPLRKTGDNSINRGELQAGSKVVVNLFDGGARDQVYLSLNNAEPIAMTYKVRTDPFVESTYLALQDTDGTMDRPTRSSHIWELPLPDSLPAGLNRVEVISEDEFGQTRRGAMSFEVLASP